MITLEASQTLAGVASAATSVTYSIFGLELNSATSAETYKVLAQGQLAAAAATIYTATANGPTFIKAVFLANATAGDITGIKIFAKGLLAANQLTGTITIPANGTALYADGVVTVYSNAGVILSSVNITLTGDVTGVGTGNSVATTIANSAVTLAKMANMATDSVLGRDSAGSGAPEVISIGGGLEFTGGGGIQRSALTGDVAATAGSGTTAIGASTVTNAKMANMANNTVKGNISGGAAAPSDMTQANLMTLMNTASWKPKDFEGRVYIDTANSQGWAGADFGAWVNSAYAYLVATYTANYGGVIEVAPGNYSFSTPIVMATVGFSVILRGSGDGNAGTRLYYSASTGTAISVGGGSGNHGGITLEDFSLLGTSASNATIGIYWGCDGPVVGIAGSYCKNVSVDLFGKGMDWKTGGYAYAQMLINCKIQYCTTGINPTNENIMIIGGLIGNCATGMACVTAGEIQLSMVAFDDNSVTGVNISHQTARVTMLGCRFENAGGGTDTYITMSAGALAIYGGAMQSDIISSTTSTGFIQQSGGVLALYGTWCLVQGSRVMTQICNISGTAYANLNPVIAPGCVGIKTTFTAGYGDATTPIASSPRNDGNSTTLQSQTVVAGTYYYIAGSNLKVPAAMTPGSGIRVGTTYTWQVGMTKNAAGTAAFNIRIYLGVGGAITDTALVTQSIGTSTAVADNMLMTVQVSWTAIGAGTGAIYWSIVPSNKAPTATGFGVASGTIPSGTVGSLTSTTAGLIMGLGFMQTTGTPLITVPQVIANISNLG